MRPCDSWTSLGKMPTTSARRLTSLLRRSSEFVLSLVQCCAGNSMYASTSCCSHPSAPRVLANAGAADRRHAARSDAVCCPFGT